MERLYQEATARYSLLGTTTFKRCDMDGDSIIKVSVDWRRLGWWTWYRLAWFCYFAIMVFDDNAASGAAYEEGWVFAACVTGLVFSAVGDVSLWRAHYVIFAAALLPIAYALLGIFAYLILCVAGGSHDHLLPSA